MKKIFALCLAALMLCAFAVPALADGIGSSITTYSGGEEETAKPTLTSTVKFAEALDAYEIKYIFDPLDDGNEVITIYNQGAQLTYSVLCVFPSDSESVAMRVFGIITYDSANTAAVMEKMNSLNELYRWVKFTADTSNSTVTLALDLILRESNPELGDETMEALVRLAEIIDDASDELLSIAVVG